jgi:hypothetical protein
LWLICSGFSPVLFPFRYFACRLVHFVFHPWIVALLHPCLALGCCFVKVGSKGAGFLTELTELTKWQDFREIGYWYEAVLWLFGFTTSLFPEL